MNLVTWNMQGSNASTENKWNTGVQQLLSSPQTNASIICLQECGAVPLSAQAVNLNIVIAPVNVPANLAAMNPAANVSLYTWGTARTNKYILFYPADPNGNRCNLAIVSKTPPVSVCYLVWPAPPSAVWRPALGFQYSPNTWVFTMHAISGSGVDAAPLLTAINGLGLPNWIAAGDYNREPNTLPGMFSICPPNNCTYSVTNPVSRYDYCVRNPANPAIVGSAINISAGLSDHIPVLYTNIL